MAISGLLGLQAFAVSANPIKGKTIGHCRLTNVDYGRDLYNGTCKIKETIDGRRIQFEIKMPHAEAFLFGSDATGQIWMTGPHQVKFRDRGHSAVFRWDSFRLEVEED